AFANTGVEIVSIDTYLFSLYDEDK
uniref:Major pollen allergen Ole e 4 (Fragments) n=1 Tax=Olea europaea TaxID=4146 RepID=ALL4_OLEEU|nr:RecName: Full=Major pollen allergen Ole e 4; AltName: Full=Allergen Ole e IV; AltName: Allergen=Ole e 4 [Olea europaea]